MFVCRPNLTPSRSGIEVHQYTSYLINIILIENLGSVLLAICVRNQKKILLNILSRFQIAACIKFRSRIVIAV